MLRKMKFDFGMPVRIVSTPDCVRLFDGYGKLGKKCVILTGKHLYPDSPVFADLYEGLQNCGVSYAMFAQVENNPSYETVLKAVDFIASEKAEFVIGVGGGSSMDAAKAAALLAANPQVRGNDIFDSSRFCHRPMPLLLIGTTAGTGSEVTAVSVLTTTSEGSVVKRSVKTPFSYADYALCDPKYTYSLPQKFTYSTALDSICHAVEAYTSKRAGLFEQNFALWALKTVMPALQDFSKVGSNAENRRDLYIGSLLAGLAINGAGTHMAHSMGYQLTNYLGYPHGFACAVLLPEVLRRYDQVQVILQAMGFERVEQYEQFSYDLIRQTVQIPVLSEQQVVAFANLAVKMPSLNNHILEPLDFDTCCEVYRNTWQKLSER